MRHGIRDMLFAISALFAGAGCNMQASELSGVNVVPFSAARADRGLVVAHHPWSGNVVDARTEHGVAVANEIGGARFSCLNAKCSPARDGVRVEPQALSGLEALEVMVECAGYETVVLRVPTRLEYPTVLVVMRERAR